MKYPESELAADETIAFDVHHHPIVLGRTLLLVLAYLAAWLTLVVLFDFFRGGWQALAGLVLLLALLALLAWRIIVWRHVNLVLTDRRLVYRSGVFSRHSREIPLRKIDDVTMYQMVTGRIFSSGDLVIKTATDAGARQSAFFDVPHPERLKREILERAHALGQGASGESARELALEVAKAVQREQPTGELPPIPPERPPLYSEIVDQIERLDSMRERGVISGAEFEEAKQAMMARLKKEPES
jgi:uncharacterized membrane protein YdbT with pleckstrin-like domain